MLVSRHGERISFYRQRYAWHKGQCFKLLDKRKFLGKEGYVVKVENIQSHLQDNV